MDQVPDLTNILDLNLTNMSSLAENSFVEEDDAEYDALNAETFGAEDSPTVDWEELHEKLSSQLKLATNPFEQEDEDSNSVIGVKPPPKASTPSPGDANWWMKYVSGSTEKSDEITKVKNAMLTELLQENSLKAAFAPLEAQDITIPKIPKFLTVEELEQKMRQEAASAALRKPAPVRVTHDHPNRDMPHTPGMAGHMSNGHYAPQGLRPITKMANKFHNDGATESQAYHRSHQMPYVPYHLPVSAPPPMAHGVPINLPRHPGPGAGQMYHRQFPNVQYEGPNRMNNPAHNNRMQERYAHNQHHKYAFYPNQVQGAGACSAAYERSRAPAPPMDEYSGLMSAQEKQWLASIQMMQLNTNQPFQDDYYFMMYQHRQQGCSSRKLGNHNHKNNREVVQHKPPATYTPLQFENSLGKLQIGSVTAPRKIIDMDLVESFDNNTRHSERKSKQILIEIEEMFNLVLTMEDAFNPLNISNKNKEEIDLNGIQNKLLSVLLSDGKLVQFMSIRKGKRVVLRCLPLLFNPSPLVDKILSDLVSITRKDGEQLLLSFLPAIRTYLSTVPLETLVLLTNKYDDHFLLSNKFTVSVMANMIERADQVKKDCKDGAVVRMWNEFLIRLVESTRYFAEPERPVVAVDRAILNRHFEHIQDIVPSEAFKTLMRTLQSTLSHHTRTESHQ